MILIQSGSGVRLGKSWTTCWRKRWTSARTTRWSSRAPANCLQASPGGLIAIRRYSTNRPFEAHKHIQEADMEPDHFDFVLISRRRCSMRWSTRPTESARLPCCAASPTSQGRSSSAQCPVGCTKTRKRRKRPRRSFSEEQKTNAKNERPSTNLKHQQQRKEEDDEHEHRDAKGARGARGVV